MVRHVNSGESRGREATVVVTRHSCDAGTGRRGDAEILIRRVPVSPRLRVVLPASLCLLSAAHLVELLAEIFGSLNHNMFF